MSVNHELLCLESTSDVSFTPNDVILFAGLSSSSSISWFKFVKAKRTRDPPHHPYQRNVPPHTILSRGPPTPYAQSAAIPHSVQRLDTSRHSTTPVHYSKHALLQLLSSSQNVPPTKCPRNHLNVDAPALFARKSSTPLLRPRTTSEHINSSIFGPTIQNTKFRS